MTNYPLGTIGYELDELIRKTETLPWWLSFRKWSFRRRIARVRQRMALGNVATDIAPELRCDNCGRPPPASVISVPGGFEDDTCGWCHHEGRYRRLLHTGEVRE